MLTLYLERLGKTDEVDFRALLSDFDHSYGINDPREYLMNPDNWVPNEVLRRLMDAVVRATGDVDAPYHAAKEYFQPGQAPSLLEVIVMVLGDVKETLLYSTLWAGGFGNHLKLQCIKPTAADPFEILILSRFDAPPVRGSISLVKGN